MPDTIEEMEGRRNRLRAEGRAAMGVTGEARTESLLRGLRRHRLTLYPMVALGLLGIIDQFQNTAFVVLGPEISRALGVPKVTVGGLLLLQYLAITIAALPIAAVVEKRARRALVAKVTGVAWSLATLITGFVTDVWSMAGLLAANGAASGSVQAVHQPLLIDSYPTTIRGRVISGYRVFIAAGTIISPLLVAALAGPLRFTWRGVFLIMGVACVLVSAVALRLRDPGFGRWDAQRLRAAVSRQGAVDEPAAEEFKLGFFEIVRRLMMIATIRRVLFAHAVLGMLLLPLNTYFVFFLEERWGLAPDKRALFFAVVPIFSVALIAALARANDNLLRNDPARIFRLGAGLQAATIILVGLAVWSPSFWLMAALFGLATGAVAAVYPALSTAYLSVIRPEMRPHAAALTGLFTVGVGGFAGLALLSGMDTRYGVEPALMIVLIPGVFSAMVLWSAARHVNADLDRTVDDLVEEEELSELKNQNIQLPMLACRNIDFSYGNLQVLFGVNFSVDDSEMVALLGTNGAGKSTLLRVISGLGLPSRGSVRYRGGDITFLDTERRVRLGITHVPGGRAVFGPLTCIENLRAYGYSLGRNRKEVDRCIEESFAVFPNLALRHRLSAASLSGGEQQMLGLAKALILRPRLLMIDELSLGLAPKLVGELLQMVRLINGRGTAVILVEQSVNVALTLVDHAYFMEKGEIRFDGPAAELLDRADLLRSVFLEGATRGLAASGHQPLPHST